MNKRKICFIITSRNHYARSKLILGELKRRKDVELQIIIGASALLPKYGDVVSSLKNDGFNYNFKIATAFEGGDPLAMAKTTGIGVTEFATAFSNLEPDVVVVRGDRYEILSAAVAAAYLNIPIAHLEGGDVTGNIDESVRHAVTKLAHIHFATNKQSKDRIIRMGEKPNYVFNFGCPGLELIAKGRYGVSGASIRGVGSVIDINKPYLMAMQHPVTSEIDKNRENVTKTLQAVHELQIPTIWLWPNIDAGTDEISKGIRIFREKNNPKNIYFIKHLPPEEFLGLLKKSLCLIGNSSAGIKECSYFGVPVVNIGSRQNGRMHAENVVDTNYAKNSIKRAIERQLKHGKYQLSNMYFQPGTGRKIAQVLAKTKLYTQKRFQDYRGIKYNNV
ncbi:MAG: UDP-N-acetylglucosamine 2-epimerase [Patescibacteria group bacterium]